MSSSRLSSATVFSPLRIRCTACRLNSVLNTRRPSAFRRCSPMGPPAASYVPTVSSRKGEHSNDVHRQAQKQSSRNSSTRTIFLATLKETTWLASYGPYAPQLCRGTHRSQGRRWRGFERDFESPSLLVLGCSQVVGLNQGPGT